MLNAHRWLEEIHRLPLRDTVRVMNVCGGHERSITLAGLRGALPTQIELIPGPGCPVCICPERDLYQAIQIALSEPVTLVAFGDMLRVPVNVPRRETRTLEQARSRGADVRPIASPSEAVTIARTERERDVVFFAAGFETTMAPVAAMIEQGLPPNLSVLMSGRLTWPAVAMLLDAGAAFDALVAPGHVATIMGPEQWDFVVERHHLPAAVAGFTPDSLVAAIYSVLRQKLEGKIFLDNCYPEVVRAGGNATARAMLARSFKIVDAEWRGVGVIPKSGFGLRRQYSHIDARLRFADHVDESRKRIGEMPQGCECASVVLGRIYPDQCRIFGTACTPRNPVGPCMVSDEGACRIWWSAGRRPTAA